MIKSNICFSMKPVYTCVNLFKWKRIHLCQVVRYASFYKKKAERNSIKYSTSGGRNRVYAFGCYNLGALGFSKKGSDSRVIDIPKPVRLLFAEEYCVTDVAAGFGFTAFAVNSQDTFKVYGCGINTDKQISGDDYEMIMDPYPINLGIQCFDTKVISMSAGRAHLAVVTDKEGVFLLGNNSYGQCGRPLLLNDKEGVFVVNCIKDLDGDPIAKVCCGQDHTLFLTNCGKVYSCGWGSDGQTGLGHTNIVYRPTKIEGELKNETITHICGRSETVLAISCDGELFGWGSNESLQLSPDKVEQINCPISLKSVNKLGKIKDCAASGTFCMVLNDCGDLYVWGYGILGSAPEVQKTNTPCQLPRTLFGASEHSADVRVSRLACGLTYAAVINSCNDLYCWGHNKHGSLGIGHLKDQYFPYRVSLSSRALKASCGVDHTIVLGQPL